MKMRLTFLLALFLAVALSAAAGFTLNVQEHTLANGLKILMVVKPGVPQVVCHVYYKAGSINEWPGITGTAHFHEHMMFKGTRIMGVTDYVQDDEINKRIDDLMNKVHREEFWKVNGDREKTAAWRKEAEDLLQKEKALIIKDDLWENLMRNGGTGLNASTSNEVTGYYVTLPSNKVELQMLLEADRMQNFYPREFYSEKNVIMEERRLSENTPGFLFSEQVNAAFYAATPYHWEVLGWMDDIKKVTRQDMLEFHNRYYVPNNAVAVYVGAFDPKRIIALAEKYFGPIPRGPENEPVRTTEPPQYSEKRLTGEGPAASSIQILYHIPAEGHTDTYPLTLLAQILSGDTGRLYQRLVKEKDLATRVMAFSRAQWYAGAFTVSAYPKSLKKVTPESLEPELWAELERVVNEGVTDPELQAAKNKWESRFYMGMQSAASITRMLGRAELNRGWHSLLTDVDLIKKVTVDDIKAVAARIFRRDNATVAIYKRKMGRPE